MKVSNPHVYFLISALVIFIGGLFTLSNKNVLIDINLYDTYFIIHLFHLITLVSFFYFTEGIIYWVLKKTKVPIINQLTQTHLYLTVGGVFFYFLLMTIFEDDTELEPGVLNETSILGWVLIVLVCAIIFSQILFFLNYSNWINKKFQKK